MERKIGEIFEYNSEWYQCIRSILTCSSCEIPRPCTKIRELGYCSPNMRNDKEQVVFKKLEKVGEPFSCDYYGDSPIMMQEYNLYNLDYVTNEDNIPMYITDYRHKRIAIEIKQNKEDVEEGKLDPHMEKVIDEATQKMGEEIGKQIEANINKQRMKPFDLQKAKAGKPVCTRDGRKARIICFDRICGDDYYKIVACVTAFDGDFEEVLSYGIDGYIVDSQNPKDEDLMMLPEKKEGWVNVYHCLNGISEYACDDIVFGTKEDATQCAKNENNYITTVKIEWEG